MTIESTHITAELLAYLDGELSAGDQALVEAHLATCAACAAELEQLRALRADLGATLDAALTPLRLPRAADARIREALRRRSERPAWQLAFLRRRGLVVQALMAVLVLFFSLNLFPVLQAGPPSVAAATQTFVVGQDRLIPGSQAALRVIVRSAESALPLLGADVTVLLAPRGGAPRTVYEGATGAGGTAEVTFAVPADLEGAADLIIETRTPAGAERVVRPITLARSARLFLSSDKPAYRPGQSFYARVLALDALTLHPATGESVTLELLGPTQQSLWKVSAAVSEFGVADAATTLPLSFLPGPYTLRATLGDTVSERAITVDNYRLPAYRITLTPDRAFYQPGDRVTGVVDVAYFFGKPVSGGAVLLRGAADGAPMAEIQGITDSQGRFTFAFNLPVDFGADALTDPVFFALDVQTTDTAGQVERLRQSLPVAAQGVLLRVLPEGGLLRRGMENTLFILAAYPDGSPAPADLRVTLDGAEYAARTDAFGLATVAFTPLQPTTQVDVWAEAEVGATGQAHFTLANNSAPQQVLLRAERALYRVGETLRVEALTAGLADSTVYLDVVRAGQTVALLSAPIDAAGRAAFALDLDPGLVGALELHAYALLPNAARVQDTRLVVVDPPGGVDVAITADAPQYRPGETATLTVATSAASTGAPIQAALGLAAVDESVYALETLPPGFARTYLLLEKEMFAQASATPGFDPAALQASEDVAARAAWTALEGSPPKVASQTTRPVPVTPLSPARVWGMTLLLALLAVWFGFGVFWGLRPVGVWERALRRVRWGLLGLALVGWLALTLLAGGVWLLQAVAGSAVTVGLLAVMLGLPWAVLVVEGWRRGDARLQIAAGLLAAYLATLVGLVWAAGQGAPVGAALIALVVLTYLALLLALATLGQGLLLEGRRTVGWLITALALLLIVFALCLPLISGLASDLSRALGNPALYAGPVGWMAGCGPTPTAAPATQAPATQAPATQPPSTSAPTQAPAPTPTAMPLPPEVWPLRQLFPETLYWQPEALTDETGRLTFTLPLADSLTTWRLTALASTRAGELGAATYDLVVFQDFFVELTLPDSIRAGEPLTVTATLYNFLPEAQTVRLSPAPGDGYTSLVTPGPIRIDSQGVTTATLVIRPERAGAFQFQVAAAGERMSDAVAVSVQVEP